MPYCNQDLWLQCESLAPGPDDPQPLFGGMTYNQALEQDHLYGVNGIDLALSQFNLDAVVSATANPAWATDLIWRSLHLRHVQSCRRSGLPASRCPQARYSAHSRAARHSRAPMGISFFGTAFSEPTLIKLASGFEAVTQARANNLPTFAQTVPNYNIQGTTLSGKQNITVPAAGSSKAPASNQATTVPARPKPLHHL